jgi:hypothetical protein
MSGHRNFRYMPMRGKNHEMDWRVNRTLQVLSFCALHRFAQNRAVDVVMCSARISQSTFCSLELTIHQNLYSFLTFQNFSQTL